MSNPPSYNTPSGRPLDPFLVSMYHQGLRSIGTPAGDAMLTHVRGWLNATNLTMFDLPLPADGSLYPAAGRAAATIFAAPSPPIPQPPVFQFSQPSSGPTVATNTVYVNPMATPSVFGRGEAHSGDVAGAEVTFVPSAQSASSSRPADLRSDRPATPATARASCTLQRPPATPHPQRAYSTPGVPEPPLYTPAFIERAQLVSRFSALNVASPSYSTYEDETIDVTNVSSPQQSGSSTAPPATTEPSTPAILPPDSPEYKRPGQKKTRSSIRKVAGHELSDAEKPATPVRSLRPKPSNKRLATSPPGGNPSSKASREDLSRDAVKSSRVGNASSTRAAKPSVPADQEASGQRSVANRFGLESGHPLLNLIPHIFAKPALGDLGPAGELKCLSCVMGFIENCEAQERITEPTASDISRALKHSLIPGARPCKTCAAKHTAHCSQQKPAVLWGNMSESLRPPTLVSNQHVLSRLRHLMSDWDEVHQAKNTLDRALARYQYSVSEFAEELLIADEYFQSDPNFWTEIGLVSSSQAAEQMLDSAREALSVQEGASARDAAARLFALHATATIGLHDDLREGPMAIPIPAPLDWHDRHAPVVARYPATETGKPKVSKKGGNARGDSKAGN
ncbi:hypothetical protein NP233_g11633 [Leucocoprinus birnbaumii]|uniref:Uncharacterized protein n=1 Tax=Leucocoprinus birnbaumii TaxID=56174 RepID=A0AAD5VG32_9AGAR|nr:hypothetical protein NP233_g11633 [Leucocoprinus birnbaumii]